jgi:glycolate oxidase FAD binding subunit
MNVGDAGLRRVSEQIREASAARTALEVRGGGTKSFYGNPPRGEPLDTRELTGITSYEPTELVITARAGTPLSELEEVLAARGQCLPFEPPRFGDSGTVGGMVAAGLSGPARAAVGPLRDFVLGVSMLNGSGDLLTFGGQVMKNVAGYDVSRVLAGSLGILGVISDVSLKVMPAQLGGRTLCFECDETTAMRLLQRWAASGAPVTASCWYAGRLTVRLAGDEPAVSRLQAPAGGQELPADEALRWWADLRDHRHEFFSGEPLWRLAVPETSPPLALAGAQLIEWNGAQRWYRGSASAAALRQAAHSVGGHATLFRGVDKSAGAFAPLSRASLELHRRLKQCFDPNCVFNPGRLYAEL